MVQAAKQTTYNLVGASAGHRILDVGCGAGDDVRALAALVGPQGRAVGIDLSRSLVTEARARSSASSLPTAYCLGTAYSLPFPDASFDGVRSERMLQWLSEAERAVREMARVTRPGGHVADFDPDWGTFVVDSRDRELTHRILSFRFEEIPHYWVGRELVDLFSQAGLQQVTVYPQVVVWRKQSDFISLPDVVDGARAAGVVSADEASAWMSEMRDRDAAGRFFAAFTAYVACGRKV